MRHGDDTALSAKSTMAVVDGKSGVSFEGHVALLVVYRRIDGDGEDLKIVEVLDENTAAAKAVFRRNAVDAAKAANNTQAAA